MLASKATATSYWRTLIDDISASDTILMKGKVSAVSGDLIKANFICPEIGAECIIGNNAVPCEVISVSNDECVLLGFEDTHQIKIHDEVVVNSNEGVGVCAALLGRVIDGLGRAIDGKGAIRCTKKYSLYGQPSSLLARPLINEQLQTSIKVIDAFTPIGLGQRIAIFSGSGVGKSTLLGMLARNSKAQVNIVALVGERGREVKELIEYDIGEEGMKNTVVVAASSEQSPAVRIRAVHYACAIAEYFRDLGNDVCLLVDSLTRVAHAQREIGMMRGEAPVARGFPPSLYRILPQIVERCGNASQGSITGVFTVLVEGDDEDEPVSDIVRGIVDGHIVLKREMAEQMHYPALHIVSSLSRVATRVQKPEVLQAAAKIRQRLGLYEQSKDIINAGVYTKGANRLLDVFLNVKNDFDNFVTQGIAESVDTEEVESFLIEFAERL